MEQTKWQDLSIAADGQTGDQNLGEFVADPENRRHVAEIVIGADGSLESWEQFFISDTDEYDWDTPRGPVDWTGFAEAVATATYKTPWKLVCFYETGAKCPAETCWCIEQMECGVFADSAPGYAEKLAEMRNGRGMEGHELLPDDDGHVLTADEIDWSGIDEYIAATTA